jgi:hypothetical protein
MNDSMLQGSFCPPISISSGFDKQSSFFVIISAGFAIQALNIHDSAAIFAKACFGHPSPSKRQK